MPIADVWHSWHMQTISGNWFDAATRIRSASLQPLDTIHSFDTSLGHIFCRQEFFNGKLIAISWRRVCRNINHFNDEY